MPLKAQYPSEQDIPEAHRPFYVARDGAFVLDAEGVEDVSGLKSALERLKAERRELQQQAERFKGVDPEQYHALRQQAEALEAERLKKEGRQEEIWQGRLKKQAEEAAIVEQRLRAELGKERVDKALMAAALAAGVREDAIPDAVASWSGRIWRLNDKGEAQAFDGDTALYGKSGDPVAMSDWVAEQLHAKPYLAKPSSGVGATHQGSLGTSRTVALTRDQAKDSRTYEAAKAAAAQTGAQLVIEG
jgi:hypothetical protein